MIRTTDMQIHVIIIICTNERGYNHKMKKSFRDEKHIVCKHNEIENDGGSVQRWEYIIIIIIIIYVRYDGD